MNNLIPSGRFAQLARLSRKALRIYAESGLLRPVFTDRDSGYHYYSQSQLEEAWRISHLRELGMSLDTIQQTMRVWHTPDLRLNLERQRQQLVEQEAALRKAIADLDQLMVATKLPYAVSTKLIVAQPCLAKRQLCAPEHTCDFIDSAEIDLSGVLSAAFGKPTGALIVRYHEATNDEMWDVEVCQPFVTEYTPTLPRDIKEIVLPAGRLAYTVHFGDCGGSFGMQAGYEAIWEWVRAHGHNVIGPPQEAYLFHENNSNNSADYRTEIGWMIE
jgi:DNA-binding transcriptional MerR regulator